MNKIITHQLGRQTGDLLSLLNVSKVLYWYPAQRSWVRVSSKPEFFQVLFLQLFKLGIKIRQSDDSVTTFFSEKEHDLEEHKMKILVEEHHNDCSDKEPVMKEQRKQIPDEEPLVDPH